MQIIQISQLQKFGNSCIQKTCFLYSGAEHIVIRSEKCCGQLNTEFSQWLNTKLLGTGVSVIVIYWGRFSVQWSSNPHFHLCGIVVTGLWYKTCKVKSIAVTSQKENNSQIHILRWFYFIQTQYWGKEISFFFFSFEKNTNFKILLHMTFFYWMYFSDKACYSLFNRYFN